MKMKVFLFCLLCVFLSMTVFARGGNEGRGKEDHNHDGHDHSEELAQMEDDDARILEGGFKEMAGDGFLFRWRIQDDTIEFTMEAPTLGWLAVGFEPSFMMKDADFTLAYVKDGTVFATDDFGVGATSHQPDTRQGGTDNITILGGRELDNSTVVQIMRPLDSGDAYDQVLVPGKEIKVIFAWGRNGADNFTSIHSRRGSFTIEL